MEALKWPEQLALKNKQQETEMAKQPYDYKTNMRYKYKYDANVHADLCTDCGVYVGDRAAHNFACIRIRSGQHDG